MKALRLIVLFLLPFISVAQTSQVRVFKHELRWTDESRFPNYFTDTNVRKLVFDNLRDAIIEKTGYDDVLFPAQIEYNIISGFGNQNTKMPSGAYGDNLEIGLFSFITRATSGFAIFWKMKIIIRQNSKTILEKEVSHELEYFNPAGYIESQRWMSSEDFVTIFDRLVREAVGLLPYTHEKIVLGSMESFEEKVYAMAPESKKHFLKINGAWKTGGNFSALIESDTDTLLSFNFREGWLTETAKPSMSSVLAKLFTETTGIDLLYDQNVRYQLNGTLQFSDSRKYGLKLKWIDIETRSAKSGEATSVISNPVTTELFDQHAQAGYFLYSCRQHIRETDQTTAKLNIFTGMQTENSLGVDKVHSIEGSLYDIPVYAEFNEGEGIISIWSEDEILCSMIVINCNPESSSVSNQKLSKNKRVMSSSGQSIVKPSLENEKRVEWYPVYLKEGAPESMHIGVVQTLVCLFFSMGNLEQ